MVEDEVFGVWRMDWLQTLQTRRVNVRDRTEYRIICTYGTKRGMLYAAVDNPEDARKLKATAISLGYRDAYIDTVELEDRRPPKEEPDATDLAETTWVAAEGETDPRLPDRKGREVRNLRRKSEATKYATPA